MLKPSNLIRHLPRRAAFTLVELMIVISILGVLTTLSLVVLRNSTEQAKESATRSRMEKIESILQMELEMYETRRLPISNRELLQYIQANGYPESQRANVLLNLRRRILQDLINVEMPRLVVIGGNSDTSHLGVFPSTNQSAHLSTENIPQDFPPSFDAWLNTAFPIPYSPNPDFPGVTLSARLKQLLLASADLGFWRMYENNNNLNLSGEYLYLLLSRINYDGVPAIETFNKNSIADTDGDGLLELVDAWGEPLNMAIYQVAATSTGDTWIDNPNQDWSQTVYVEPFGFYPVGYTTLKSTIPRELNQIRVKVFSNRMELIN